MWVLFAAGVLALHFPLVGLWGQWADGLGIGAPFVVALFVVWALLIAALAVIVERAPD
ncbi:hypothetical protein [Tepidimonas sp.]|uniref:hypothetical protein n=1 Tax=Tepidimonas sp. TaxID=2002775 RepID=UPI002FE40FE2